MRRFFYRQILQFINEVSGSDLVVSDDLESCTADVQTSSLFIVCDRQLKMIDTPGFDDTNKTDAQILSEIAIWLGKLYVY
jgi:predicted GTPase